MVFVLLLLLIALNAFNVRSLNPTTTAQIFLLTSLSVLVFLLFVTVLVLLLRNLIKLLAEQRSQVLGARLRTRMFIGALLLSFVPALFMFLFSFLLMNRSIDRWFSEPASEVRDDSTKIAMELSHYASLNARSEAESMARSPALSSALGAEDRDAIVNEMRAHQITLQGGFAVLYRDSAPVAAYQLPQTSSAAEVHSWLNNDDRQKIEAGQPLAGAILRAARRSDEPMLVAGGTEYALGAASLPGGGVVVAGLPMPTGLNAIVQDLSTGTSQYWALYRQRRIIRMTYFLLLLMLTALVFFASSWLALNVSRQMTGPLEALADATVEIGKGHYSHRVTAEATAEMSELVRAFNAMAADLEQSRLLAETSARELSAANLAVEARRKELETVLETIPSGVVTLDASRRIVLGNRAFAEQLRLEGQPDLAGTSLDALLPAEFNEELTRLERRARRMGVASSEFELRTPRGLVNLSVTLAALDPPHGQNHGSILVLEDLSEFLHAQRQAAWKEVAQRVAHEIRNPLTPITLSAERIRRHIDRGLPESAGVIRKCCDVILGSVESMRTLVGPVRRSGGVSRRASALLGSERDRRQRNAALRRAHPEHPRRKASGPEPAAGDGRSGSAAARGRQPHRQCRGGHAGEPAARAFDRDQRRRTPGHGGDYRRRHWAGIDRRDEGEVFPAVVFNATAGNGAGALDCREDRAGSRRVDSRRKQCARGCALYHRIAAGGDEWRGERACRNADQGRLNPGT